MGGGWAGGWVVSRLLVGAGGRIVGWLGERETENRIPIKGAIKRLVSNKQIQDAKD